MESIRRLVKNGQSQKPWKPSSTHIVKIYGKETPLWVSVLHGQLAEQATKLAALVQQKVNVKKLEILRISPVLGVHTGPGIVGLAVVPIHLMEGLD